METLFNSIYNKSGLKLSVMATAIILVAQVTNLQSTPQDWMFYFEDDKVEKAPVELSLACRPEVNVSLGVDGYAVLTAITLVLAPSYPAFLYDVDIMGPLNDTVFCEQIGQELMVVVTELPTGNSCMSTVFVEDKLRPVLTCTPDTLPCNVDIPSIDFENYLDAVTDNCDDDPDLFYSYVVQNLPCNPHGFTQQILVTWTATDDSGNSATCQDIIYLKKPALGQIEFPADTSVSCTNPNIDPSVTGEPTFNGEPLGLTCQYLVFFTDQVVPMCNGAQKIIRLWTVMDWCNSGQITDVQVILIIDNVPPVLTCPANLTIGTNPGVCTTKYTLPMPVVSDACATTSMIDIDIFVSSVPGIFSPGQMINLGLGVSTITIRATDPCGNSSMCSYTLTVKDNTPPIPICHSITIGLGPDGMATLFANSLDFVVIENCGILSKQIWRMTNTCGVPEDLIPGPDVKFCCADAGDTLMVAFKVTDLSGNMNTCMFQVFVKDQLPPTVDCEDLTISITNQGTIVIDPADVVTSASDNCFVVDTFVTPGTFDCNDIGENQVIVTVTDQSGNTSTCTAIVTIVDEVPPVAICQNVTVTLVAMTATITTVQVNNGSSDNCGIDTMFLNQYTFDCDDIGTQIVQLTVVDLAGNTATCTATITILTTPPIALCQDITVFLNEAGTVTILADSINNGSSDDCEIDTMTVTPPTFDCDNLGPNTVILTVTDNTGNTATCTATVTVQDTIPPVALCQDISIMLDSMGMATIIADSINNGSTDNCFIVNISIDSTEFDCTEAGDNIITLTVTDQSGNTSTCTATVMVMMPDPPTALCQDITVTIGPGGIVVITPQQIDNGSFAQCGDVTLTINADTFDCEDLGSGIVVTLTVTDETFNSSTCTATVTVVENPPVAICQNITVSLVGNMVTITGEQVNNNSTDDCGIIDYDVIPASFDCSDLGPNTVVLTVTDQSGNTSTCTAIVTVQDNTDPIAVCQDITVAIGPSGIVIITGIQINNGSTDNCGGPLTLTTEPDTLDCDNLGENIVTLTVSDQSGNTSTCTATVTLTSTPPIAVCQDITVSIGVNGTIVVDPGAVNGGSTTACGTLEFSLDENTFDCTELGENIVILTVSNGSSSDTCTATITVVDDTDPTCSASNLTVYVNAAGNVSILPGQINNGSTDNCTIVSFTVDPDDFTCDDLGPNIVTLTVTDQSANSSTCTSTVTVLDTISPVCNTQNITVSINGSGTVTILPSQINNGSSDNCGPVSLDVDPDTFDCDNLGPNTVVLTVTDGSGNNSTCTATVTITETGGLEANCQNVTIFVDVNGNASVDPEDINNGSGGGCTQDTLTFALSQTEFNCTDLGPNIVTLTVTDMDGNTATCTAIVTVDDNINPTITCPPNVTVECNSITNPNNTSQFGNATANDNCPGVTIQENAVFNLNNCNVGTITRTFTATDASGNTAVCTQVVTFINSNPFTEDDITWPPTPITVNICNSTDPDDLPNGEPVFDPASMQCANPVASFSDQVQTIIDNDPNTPCKIITRTWTVTDNCQPGVSFVFVQTINVIDTAPPVFTNINDMTKVANANCVAFFTLIASATDCAGVTITNNSPFGVNSGANASGNYPIGVTTVLFTATDGCGNISTMDVVLTVTDPDPTEFQCEKVIVILPEETEITLNAETFVIFFPGNCTNEDDFIVSYSDTDPFDTTNVYDCGDVGVSTFPLWFWNLSGTVLVDSCSHADLDLRDPDDHCGDGLALIGNVENEDGLAVSGVVVQVTNAAMLPVTTNTKGQYLIEGLNVGTGYEIAPFRDIKHRVGVSTLDLVLIQKHLLGISRLNSPYKMIAADANKSGHITAFDLLEIRKLILGITSRFPNNTSWRFIDRNYSFPNPYDPFNETFAESIWIDSITSIMGSLDFIGVKIGDVNGSYFLSAQSGPKIEPRSSTDFHLEILKSSNGEGSGTITINVVEPNGSIDGLQFSLTTGGLSDDQLNAMTSEVLDDEHWYYDEKTGIINVSWTNNPGQHLKGKTLLEWHSRELEFGAFDLNTGILKPEAYDLSSGVTEVKEVVLSKLELPAQENAEYHLFQNKPNPFVDGTVISFVLPQAEEIRLIIYDITGKQVFEYRETSPAGRNDVFIKSQDLKLPGIYYYTLYTSNASFTRKMSFTNN